MTGPKDIYDQLRRDEGVRHEMYVDTTGWLTIGVGHNLRARPLSDAAVDQILRDDVQATDEDLRAAHPWVQTLSPARYGAVLNVAFNAGVEGLGGFKRMLVALQNERWAEAARELLDSTYAKQVGDRARRLAKQLETDQWQ